MKQKIYKNYNFKKIMGKIVAIGGGEIGRPGTKIETLEIDTEIIKLTNKKNPKLLFIPTASNDSTGYYDVVKNYFGKKLGCDVSVLYLINETHTKKNIENKILSSDIIYVGGGNTLKMMTLWRKYEVDKILKKAYDNGIVMTGISAGSICWFNFGNSDSRKFTSDSSKLIKVTGLGFIDALHCPHYDVEKDRQEDLKQMMQKNSKIVSIALENCSALEIVDKTYRIITSNPTAKAYKIYWERGVYHKEEILQTTKFQNLELLLLK